MVPCVPLNENELKNEFKYLVFFVDVCVIGLNEFRVDSLRGHSPVTDSFIPLLLCCFATTYYSYGVQIIYVDQMAAQPFVSDPSKMKGK